MEIEKLHFCFRPWFCFRRMFSPGGYAAVLIPLSLCLAFSLFPSLPRSLPSFLSRVRQREVPPALAMQQQREMELQRQHQMMREQQQRQQHQQQAEREHQLHMLHQQVCPYRPPSTNAHALYDLSTSRRWRTSLSLAFACARFFSFSYLFMLDDCSASRRWHGRRWRACSNCSR